LDSIGRSDSLGRLDSLGGSSASAYRLSGFGIAIRVAERLCSRAHDLLEKIRLSEMIRRPSRDGWALSE
jgi:hypothetical protein